MRPSQAPSDFGRRVIAFDAEADLYGSIKNGVADQNTWSSLAVRASTRPTLIRPRVCDGLRMADEGTPHPLVTTGARQ